MSKDLKEAKSTIDKILGLNLNNNPRSLLIKTHFGIHTFFLKEKIDIIVLDSKLKVVKAKTVKPNSIFIYNPLYSILLELPCKTIKTSHTKIGDKLFLK